MAKVTLPGLLGHGLANLVGVEVCDRDARAWNHGTIGIVDPPDHASRWSLRERHSGRGFATRPAAFASPSSGPGRPSQAERATCRRYVTRPPGVEDQQPVAGIPDLRSRLLAGQTELRQRVQRFLPVASKA